MNGGRTNPLIEAHFDWYRATVPAHPALILDRVQEAIEAGGARCTRTTGKGRFNYHELTSVCVEDEAVVKVLHGGPNGHPNVESSGSNAPALAGFLRDVWPEHSLTRGDVALDLQADGLFNSMVRTIGVYADRYRLKCTSVINRDPAKGDTYYLGSRSSAVFVRCYEKGKQLQSVQHDGRSLGLDDWVRLELECKPLKPFRGGAAKLEPAQFWGLSEWTMELAKEVAAMDVKPIKMRPQVVADHERAMRFLASQYGPTILRQLERCDGNKQVLVDDLLDRIRGEGEHADSGPRMAEYQPGKGWNVKRAA
jgi:DNA relaxase NicK